MTDSSTGGFLPPILPIQWVGADLITFDGDGPLEWSGAGFGGPLEDDALDDFLQALVAGITGLSGQMVRPRWQPEPPEPPAYGTTWAAIGVTGRRADTFAVEWHDPTGNGEDVITRHEELDLLCTFYGPQCQNFGARLRDGLSVSQNREILSLYGMGLVSTGDMTKAPELIKNRWVPRADLTVVIRRRIDRAYGVLNILSFVGTLVGDAAAGPITRNISKP